MGHEAPSSKSVGRKEKAGNGAEESRSTYGASDSHEQMEGGEMSEARAQVVQLSIGELRLALSRLEHFEGEVRMMKAKEHIAYAVHLLKDILSHKEIKELEN